MAFQCIYEWSDEGGEDGDGKEEREWRLPGVLYADDLVLRAMVGRFVEVCRRRGLKINGGKSKVMEMNGEDGLECEVHVDGARLEHVAGFKYI